MSTKKNKSKKSGSKTNINKTKSQKKKVKYINSDNKNNFENKKESILNVLKEINLLSRQVKLELKELESLHKKEIKNISKNKKNPDKQFGINKPEPVPKPLQQLLKINDVALPRSHISALIYAYVKKNNLYSPETKKIIIPNKKMRDVFGMKQKDIITFTNFQTWLKKAYSETDDLILNIND